MSQERVIAIQRRLNVPADGVIGPQTLLAIERALNQLAELRRVKLEGGRRVSNRGIALLHHFEGCKLIAYQCPAGIWTIGWGNTRYEDGAPVKRGDTITQDRANELFRAILTQFEDGVEQVAPGAPLHQFEAMVSLAYNIGLDAFRASTVLRRHLAGNHDEAGEAFLMWNRASGKIMPGLIRRREAERLLYLADFVGFQKAIGG